MLAELRTKSQITIPKEIVSSLGLSEGDKFEVFEKDGTICFMPVVVYPKKYVEELRSEVKKLMVKEKNGKQGTFGSVSEMLGSLDK